MNLQNRSRNPVVVPIFRMARPIPLQPPSEDAQLLLYPQKASETPLINRKLPIEVMYYIFNLIQLTSPSQTLTAVRLVHSTWNLIALPLAYQSITLTPTLLTPSLRARLPNPTLIFRSIYLHTRHVKIDTSAAQPHHRDEVITILNKCTSLEAVTYVYGGSRRHGHDHHDQAVGWTPSDLRHHRLDRGRKLPSLLIENFRLGFRSGSEKEEGEEGSDDNDNDWEAAMIPTDLLVSLDYSAESEMGPRERMRLKELVERCPRLRVLRYRDGEVSAEVRFCRRQDEEADGRGRKVEDRSETREALWSDWSRSDAQRARTHWDFARLVKFEVGTKRCKGARRGKGFGGVCKSRRNAGRVVVKSLG
ncbi:hypothetical protein QBC42DRAFT_47407 [Cladorrhinum samala]|uniref:F-box domain-containing protein n=1 Tax=Cladorrhinum samala TaxID=585594 RepID=A0AAV9H8Y6_9PEZI|nr:hypothetical protein QBC42DRAFT_47407 [Cladorrhinum samala]